jgi:hypothetical protein
MLSASLPFAQTCGQGRRSAGPDGHYCPVCLRRVPAADARRQSHQEPGGSDALEVVLLCCPTCGLALVAEVLDPAGACRLAAWDCCDDSHRCESC